MEIYRSYYLIIITTISIALECPPRHLLPSLHHRNKRNKRNSRNNYTRTRWKKDFKFFFQLITNHRIQQALHSPFEPHYEGSNQVTTVKQLKKSNELRAANTSKEDAHQVKIQVEEVRGTQGAFVRGTQGASVAIGTTTIGVLPISFVSPNQPDIEP
ncbi:hypothetical protein Ddye_027537 [Dipteronia dyeriana]|uniref:Uncharacterized protein n=1 Tax=Dipteronia dyeriana TaxID=168575 RepID=A0AAD9TPB6_9ROSI|nr:hypothetical protein Ddye_027537 [Dipteronia dyeriana]